MENTNDAHTITTKIHLQKKLHNIIYSPHVIFFKIFHIYFFLQVFSELQEKSKVYDL